MKFTDGVEQALLKRDLPIITYYDFFVLGHALFESKAWDGEPLKRMPQGWDQTRANNAIKRMEERKALVPDSDFRSGVWRVTQATRAGSAEEVVCIAEGASQFLWLRGCGATSPPLEEVWPPHVFEAASYGEQGVGAHQSRIFRSRSGTDPVPIATLRNRTPEKRENAKNPHDRPLAARPVP